MIARSTPLHRKSGTRLMLGSLVVGLAVGLGCSGNPERERREYLESGNALMAQNKPADAIVQYRNALKADAKFGEARLRLAEAYAQTGDMRRAAQEYFRAADLMPESADAQVKAGTLLLLGGRFEDAKSRAEKALEGRPEERRRTDSAGQRDSRHQGRRRRHQGVRGGDCPRSGRQPRLHGARRRAVGPGAGRRGREAVPAGRRGAAQRRARSARAGQLPVVGQPAAGGRGRVWRGAQARAREQAGQPRPGRVPFRRRESRGGRAVPEGPGGRPRRHGRPPRPRRLLPATRTRGRCPHACSRRWPPRRPGSSRARFAWPASRTPRRTRPRPTGCSRRS